MRSLYCLSQNVAGLAVTVCLNKADGVTGSPHNLCNFIINVLDSLFASFACAWSNAWTNAK